MDVARDVESAMQPKVLPQSVPVLVVGAGPTGLLMAAELHRRGVPCHLIDAQPAPLHWDRATVLHPRSLQIFEAIGEVDKLLDLGCKQRVIAIHSGGKSLGRIDLSLCGSVYGFNLGVSEEVTESILTAYLHRQGEKVNRSSRLVGFASHADGVVADVECNGERYQIAARWVVGCDGIHSAIRELSGIGFDGHKLQRQWAVFDTTVEAWPDTYEGIFVYQDRVPIILTPLPGKRWRIYLRPTSAESDLVADAAATLHAYVPAASFIDIENPTRFNCYTKIAAQFRAGPVFLAGDSAHLSSPAEGHGMNTGIQDAFNLAWKLALVHDGTAHPRLLDSYQAERRPIAQMITQSGDMFERAQMLTDPVQRDLRDQATRDLLTHPSDLRHQVMAETELIIDYAQSPIVCGGVCRGLVAGHRLPDTLSAQWPDRNPCGLHHFAHRPTHTLLLLAGPAADTSALVELHAALQTFADASPLFEDFFAFTTASDVPVKVGTIDRLTADRLGVSGMTLLAMRPDGYVGLRSDHGHLAALRRYCTLIQEGTLDAREAASSAQ